MSQTYCLGGLGEEREEGKRRGEEGKGEGTRGERGKNKDQRKKEKERGGRGYPLVSPLKYPLHL